jgi:hypothetical protein
MAREATVEVDPTRISNKYMQTNKPFQFRLGSLFVLTAVAAMAVWAWPLWPVFALLAALYVSGGLMLSLGLAIFWTVGWIERAVCRLVQKR